MKRIPKEKDIEKNYSSEEECIKYLFQQGILYKYEKCPSCSTGKLVIYEAHPKQWKCTNYKCCKKISIFKESFFAKSKPNATIFF